MKQFVTYLLKPRVQILVSIFVLFSLSAQSQAPGCPGVDFSLNGNAVTAYADSVFLNCDAECANLSADYLKTGETQQYRVESIPYAPPFPFNQGTPLFVGQDDVFSDAFQLPFDFCFYGQTFNRAIVGANGLVSFDVSLAGQYCAFQTNHSIPSPPPGVAGDGIYGYSINGAFHDMDPSICGRIYYGILGEFPCRTFVVNFHEVCHYSCGSDVKSTFQIVIYETTNAIEVYIKDRPLCTSWQDGNAYIGIQNGDGTDGITPPNRNTGAWSAQEEAWRFIPDGNPNYTFQWLDENGVSLGSQSDIEVCVDPFSEQVYTAEIEYLNCNGQLIHEERTVLVARGGSLNPNMELLSLTPSGCEGECTGQADVFINDQVYFPLQYSITNSGGTVVNAGTLNKEINNQYSFTDLCGGEEYTVSLTDPSGCTGEVKFVIPSNEFNAELVLADTVCEGVEVDFSIIPELGSPLLDIVVSDGSTSQLFANVNGTIQATWVFDFNHPRLFIESIIESGANTPCVSGPFTPEFPFVWPQSTITFTALPNCKDSLVDIEIYFSEPPLFTGSYSMLVSDSYGNSNTVHFSSTDDSFSWPIYRSGEIYFSEQLEHISECGFKIPEQTIEYETIPPPSLDVTTNQDKICVGQKAAFQLNLLGNPPFEIEYYLGGNLFNHSISSSPHILEDFPSDDISFSLVKLTDIGAFNKVCPYEGPINKKINVYDSLRIDLLEEDCVSDGFNLNVEVAVQVLGGDSTTFFFNNTYHQSTTIFHDPQTYQNGEEYTITVEDQSGCPEASLENIKYCFCISQAPGLIRNLQRKCSADPVELIVDPDVPAIMENDPGNDIHDTLVYVVHSSSGINLLDPILFIPGHQTHLNYHPSMNFEQLYYVSAVVGNKDYVNNFIKLQDTCLNVSRGIPFIFSQSPVINYNLPIDSICPNDSTYLYLDIQGKGAFSLTLENDFGGTEVFEGLNNLDSVPLTGSFSRTFFIDRVDDVNDPACSGSVADPIHLHVHKYVEALLEGETAFCAGDSAELNLSFRGTPPWYLDYTIDGVPQPTFKTYENELSWFVHASSTYQLTAVQDTFCLGTVSTDPIQITEKQIPTPDAGGDRVVCGLTFNLQAIASGFPGRWHNDQGLIFAPAASHTTEVTAPEIGSYTVSWTEESEGCAVVHDEITLQFTAIPQPQIPEDIEFCGGETTLPFSSDFNQIIFEDFDGVGWTITNTMDSVTIRDVYGSGRIVLSDRSPFGCFGYDTLDLALVEPLNIDLSLSDCDANGETFNLDIVFTGGLEDYQINGTPTSSPTQINSLVSGDIQNLVLEDASVCPDSTINYPLWCPCTTLAGDFQTNKVYLCRTGDHALVDFYLGGEVLQPNDSLSFVLADNLTFFNANYLDTLESLADLLTFSEDWSTSTEYYLFPIAGNHYNAVADSSDRCFNIGRALPLEFLDPITISAPDTIFVCDGEDYTVPITIENSGSYSFTLQQVTATAFNNSNGLTPTTLTVDGQFLNSNFARINDIVLNSQAENCSVIDNDLIRIEFIDLPTAQIGFDTTFCTGMELDLTLVPPLEDHLISWTIADTIFADQDHASVLFTHAGTYTAELTLTDSYGCTQDLVFNNLIDIEQTPVAEMSINPNANTTFCNGTLFEFSDISAYDSLEMRTWLHEGAYFSSDSSFTARLDTTGLQRITLKVETSFGCVDSTAMEIEVSGPDGQILYAGPQSICLGENIELTANFFGNIQEYAWVFDNGTKIFNTQTITVKVDPHLVTSEFVVLLEMTDNNGCSGYEEFSIPIKNNGVEPLLNNTTPLEFCQNDTVELSANNPNDVQYTWYFNSDSIGSMDLLFDKNTFPVGYHILSIVSVDQNTGCYDSTAFPITVHQKPAVGINAKNDSICAGEVLELAASNTREIVEYHWGPPSFFDNPESNPTTFIAGQSENIYLELVDVNNCTSEPFNWPITVVNPITFPPLAFDSIVNIGQEITIPADSIDVDAFTFSWTPALPHADDSSYFRTIQPMENTEYTLILQDKLGCSITENLFRLLVDTEITVDLPDAFSPNGDGINDVIFVGGLGVEAIERFYVFNRFGQRVFESNETTLGWDGTFNGEPQPIDTYVFRVIAKGFDGHRVERTGTFRLLR